MRINNHADKRAISKCLSSNWKGTGERDEMDNEWILVI